MPDRILVAIATDPKEAHFGVTRAEPFHELKCGDHGRSDVLRIALTWCALTGIADRGELRDEVADHYLDFIADGRSLAIMYHEPFNVMMEWEFIRALKPDLTLGPRVAYHRIDSDLYFDALTRIVRASNCTQYNQACLSLRTLLTGGKGGDPIFACGWQHPGKGVSNASFADLLGPAEAEIGRAINAWFHRAGNWRPIFALARPPVDDSTVAKLNEAVERFRATPAREASIVRAATQLTGIVERMRSLDRGTFGVAEEASRALREGVFLYETLIGSPALDFSRSRETLAAIDTLVERCETMLVEAAQRLVRTSPPATGDA